MSVIILRVTCSRASIRAYGEGAQGPDRETKAGLVARILEEASSLWGQPGAEGHPAAGSGKGTGVAPGGQEPVQEVLGMGIEERGRRRRVPRAEEGGGRGGGRVLSVSICCAWHLPMAHSAGIPGAPLV